MKLKTTNVSKYFCVIAAFALFGIYCAPARVATMDQVLVKGKEKFGESLTIDDLNKGSEVMSGKCITCHRLYRPTEFSVEEWTKIVPWMAPKAALSKEEQSALYKYVVSARLTPKPQAPKKG